MITPIACERFMKPLFTKPTTMTVVTELDCTSIVTSNPVPTAISLFVVILLIRRRNPLPAIACRPSDMFFMPRRKIPSPPTTVSASDT